MQNEVYPLGERDLARSASVVGAIVIIDGHIVVIPSADRLCCLDETGVDINMMAPTGILPAPVSAAPYDRSSVT